MFIIHKKNYITGRRIRKWLSIQMLFSRDPVRSKLARAEIVWKESATVRCYGSVIVCIYL